MKPLWILCAVGLTPQHIASDMPAVSTFAGRGSLHPLRPVLPAVTTSAQTSMLTGVLPQKHGIVANGWHFRDLSEVLFWRQSEALIQAPLIWDQIRAKGKALKVLKHFWWYAMNSSADALVTPRPAYHADGRKSPDFYAAPEGLKETLLARHGAFPLWNFWGPTADIRSTRWIGQSFLSAVETSEPDLALCYLPHLDYDLQRFGPTGPHLAGNLRDLDAVIAPILSAAQAKGARVLILSEYGIEAVNQPVPINQHLRKAGLLSVTQNATGELLDMGQSQVFAVADHQIAHISCKNAAAIDAAMQALKTLAGIERLCVGPERESIGLNHPRSGEIVALAAPGAWFQYEWWLDPALAPDFAQQVEIHKKPGYDPRELFFDPQGGKARATWTLIRKFLGFRYVMNPVPLDPHLVRGSHGRLPSTPEQGPCIIDSMADQPALAQTDVAAIIARHFGM